MGNFIAGILLHTFYFASHLGAPEQLVHYNATEDSQISISFCRGQGSNFEKPSLPKKI